MLIVVALLGAFVLPTVAQDDDIPDPTDGQWCSGVNIRFFVGGAEGDAFASIILRGAQAAANDLGANVDYLFSAWDPERMIQQLRDAIAAAPDGIAMMGHPGQDAIRPLAEEAAAAGIEMMYQNVDVPDVRAAFGGGYVGANLYTQGLALGEEAIRRFDLQAGEKAIIFARWDLVERVERERGTAEALEAAGLEVIRVQADVRAATDPNLLIPAFTSSVLAHPDVRVLGMGGGQILGNIPTYMQAAGLEPGAALVIGFDTSPLIMEAFDQGWIQLTSDQQPLLQGYLPILSLCQTLVYDLAPMNVDTGGGYVDPDNYQSVAALARAGLR
ncbi:MAG: substrate-binding domain-containing protein [Chloroflexi bacterium]|nr:substrate-binding domain-containing protein [Chloroflexota bacterium]